MSRTASHLRRLAFPLCVLIALSHVARRIELPGKMIRQYGVNRSSATSSVAKTRVSVSTRDEPLPRSSTRKFIVAFAKPGCDQRLEISRR